MDKFFRVIIFCGFFFLIFGCENDTLNVKPYFTFVKGNGYTSHDTLIKFGYEIKIGVLAKAIGENNELTKMSIFKNDSLFFDTLIYREKLSFDFYFKHNKVDSINWLFVVYDIPFNEAKDSVIVLIDKNPIIRFLTDTFYIFKNTTLDTNEQARIGLYTHSYGGAELEKVKILKNDSLYFDTLISGKEIWFDHFINQDTIDTLTWKFIVYDEVSDSAFINLSTYLNF